MESCLKPKRELLVIYEDLKSTASKIRHLKEPQKTNALKSKLIPMLNELQEANADLNSAYVNEINELQKQLHDKVISLSTFHTRGDALEPMRKKLLEIPLYVLTFNTCLGTDSILLIIPKPEPGANEPVSAPAGALSTLGLHRRPNNKGGIPKSASAPSLPAMQGYKK